MAPERRAAVTFYLWHAVLPALLAIVVFCLFEYSDIDRHVSDRFYDAAAHRFPWRNDWFLEAVMHQWAKYPLVLLAFGGLAGYLLSFALPTLCALRRRLLFVFLVMALGPASVSALKDISNKHCPYDLDVYGGFAPYTRLLDATPPDIEPGRCWPGGHASGGFGLIALYFASRRRWPRRARALLALALAYGFVLGLGRILQGAHFLSHNLWAALVVWFVALGLYRLLLFKEDHGSALS